MPIKPVHPRTRADRCPTCGVEFRAPQKYGPRYVIGKTCPAGHFNAMHVIYKHRALTEKELTQ